LPGGCGESLLAVAQLLYTRRHLLPFHRSKNTKARQGLPPNRAFVLWRVTRTSSDCRFKAMIPFRNNDLLALPRITGTGVVTAASHLAKLGARWRPGMS